MESPKLYALPELPYDYAALTPHLSADLLRLYHDKHHAAYVNAANAILQKMDKARDSSGKSPRQLRSPVSAGRTAELKRSNKSSQNPLDIYEIYVTA